MGRMSEMHGPDRLTAPPPFSIFVQLPVSPRSVEETPAPAGLTGRKAP
jgi:hypothetical protein